MATASIPALALMKWDTSHVPTWRVPWKRRNSETAPEATQIRRVDVLAICPSDWDGIRESLVQHADAYSDIRDARAAILEHSPSEIRFGGYNPDWRQILTFARSRRCRIVVTIHHTPSCHEFAGSLRTALVEAITDFRQGLIDAFETPHEGVAETLTRLGIPCGVRRNTTGAPAESMDTPQRPGLHIGIFGTGMPWKNMDTQMLAASLTVRNRPGGTIHIQHIRDHALMKTLGVPYQIHSRMDRTRFHRLLASMTLNMAANFSETFGYLPVESFLLGVPCLFSPMTPAFHDLDVQSPLWRCRVDRIDDPAYISRRLEDVLEHRQEIADAGVAFCQRHLKRASDGAGMRR